jgi:hypothetical protein
MREHLGFPISLPGVVKKGRESLWFVKSQNELRVFITARQAPFLCFYFSIKEDGQRGRY